jgi:hypothetical protein
LGPKPEYCDLARKAGRAIVDANVAEKLHARAMGYSHPAVKIMKSGGRPLTVAYTQHYPSRHRPGNCIIADMIVQCVRFSNRQLEASKWSGGSNQKAGVPPFSGNISPSLDHRAMEKIMNIVTKALLAAVLFSLPVAAFAQSSDAAYCKALVTKYQQYLDQSSKKGQQPQSVDAQAAVEKCKTGDTSGIPGIEKALKDAKFDLPPRG